MTRHRGEAAGRLRVIYIAGSQHCGSTMLDAILGHAPGAQSLGEVGGFHRYQSSQTCDCGAPAASCPPCRAVIEALDSDGHVPEYLRVAPLPLKERRAYWTLVGRRGRKRYARLADAVLAAASECSGATVLVDSSKNVGRAAALAYDSRHDIRVVHLVRDGRGYLSSKQRRAEAERRRLVAPVALAVWLAKNLLLSAVLRRRLAPGRYLLCRYEDLMADPQGQLDRIGRFADLDTAGLAAASEAGVARGHLFEPQRRVDYRMVRLDPARAAPEVDSPISDRWYWTCGGFLSARWGYRRRVASGTRAEVARS